MNASISTSAPVTRAISINQPWAWLIARGHKLVENRTWNTNFRGPILIQAGSNRSQMGNETEDFVLDAHPIVFEELNSAPRFFFGSAVGIVDVVDCIPYDGNSPEEFAAACRAAGPIATAWLARNQPTSPIPLGYFASGPFCFLLENPRQFAKPFPLSGKLNIFGLSPAEVVATRAAMKSLGHPEFVPPPKAKPAKKPPVKKLAKKVSNNG